MLYVSIHLSPSFLLLPSLPLLPFSQRTSLEISVLKAKQLGMGEPREVLSHALQPPNITDIERAILNLKEVNAVFYLVSCVTTCYIVHTLVIC